MNIRTAELKDVKQIFDLLIKTPELQGSGDVDPIYSEEFVIDCITDTEMNYVLVAEDNDKIISVLIAETWKKKKYSFLTNIVVLDEYRSKGIGKEIYNKFEEHCKNNNLKSIVALVLKTNTLMQGFCEKRGYTKGNEMFFYEKEL